jgi:hypothetical protein
VASGPLSIVSRAQGARRKAQGGRRKDAGGFASHEAGGLKQEADPRSLIPRPCVSNELRSAEATRCASACVASRTFLPDPCSLFLAPARATPEAAKGSSLGGFWCFWYAVHLTFGLIPGRAGVSPLIVATCQAVSSCLLPQG